MTWPDLVSCSGHRRVGRTHWVCIRFVHSYGHHFMVSAAEAKRDAGAAREAVQNAYVASAPIRAMNKSR